MAAPIVAGIDPGAHGGIAFLDDVGNLIDVVDMPSLPEPSGRVATNAPLLAEILAKSQARVAFCEFVGARPTDAKVSAFAFGRARGVIEGVCGALSIPVQFVTPPTWKAVAGVPPGKDKKDVARARAIARWPAHAALFKRKLDCDRAEAAFIALAGLQREHMPAQGAAARQNARVAPSGTIFPTPQRQSARARPRRGNQRRNEMKTKGMFTSFWKPDSLSPGEKVELTIASVEEGDYGLVLTFEDGSKFSLNMTNGRKLERAYGDETDLWIGKTVELSLGVVTYRGEQVASVILTIVSAELSKDEQVALLPKKLNPIDDDIPF
jgi:crossover junction endodeoxyribonuclease RuvC